MPLQLLTAEQLDEYRDEEATRPGDEAETRAEHRTGGEDITPSREVNQS